MKNFNLRLLLLFLMLAFQSVTIANDERNQISAKDLALLPPFCKGLSIGNYLEDAIPFRSPDVKQPKGAHNHHFCHGMKDFNRQNYDLAIRNFIYVQENSGDPKSLTPDYYPLLAATSLYKAEALAKLGRQGAIQEYTKAIQLKPKYPQAYSKLADYYLSVGMKDDALDTIKIGLKLSPNSVILNKKLIKLQAKK